MTYQEYFEKTRKEFAIKTDAYLKAEQALTSQANGFFDKRLLEILVKAQIEWKNAANAYNTFLDFCRKHEVNPNDTMVE